MPATITRTPRTESITRTNECNNPSFDSAGDIANPATPYGWTFLGYGAGGAGTEYVGAGYSVVGSRAFTIVWSTAPTGNYHEVIGFQYSHNGWVAAATKRVSAYIFASKAFVIEMVANYYKADGTFISADRSAGVTLTAQAATRIDATITAPALTASVKLAFTLTNAGPRPAVNDVLAIDAVLIEPGAVLGTYFDGDSFPAGQGTSRTVWSGSAGASPSQVLTQDAVNVISPNLIEGWQQQRPSRNTVFELLDGTSAVVQSPAIRPRVGTLKLMFGGIDSGLTPANARAAADAAEGQLKAGLLFFLNNTDLGPLGAMTLYVNGDVIGPYPTDTRQGWRLDVPFRELT